jgi:4'-phosphopantetheinyl transferase superfamily
MYFGIVEPDTEQRRIEVLREMLLELGESNTEAIELLREPSGKQKIGFSDGRIWHCNFSRVRNALKPFGLLAISAEAELGIDVEVWPDSVADRDFLASISTPEDSHVIRSLEGFNRDAGIALWVIKEAALKCSGEVMTDPRHLAVSEFRDGFFRIGPSSLAGAPVPNVVVTLFQMKAPTWPDREFLCGIAQPYRDRTHAAALTRPALKGHSWQILALKKPMQP